MAVSKRSEDRSYEGFVDEFMDWWVQETQAHRLKQENEKKESSAKKKDKDQS